MTTVGAVGERVLHRLPGDLGGQSSGGSPDEPLIRRHILIRLKDDTEIAVSLYIPRGDGPFPTLVTLSPYHKDDSIGGFMEYPRLYFARAGYATLLADLRGTGASSGRAWDFFDTDREGADGAEVVEWTATQDWCDGNVGAWGVSYGGITALQIAARAPAHLRAIATVFATPDIFRDFLAPGGCPNALGACAWWHHMLGMDLLPPTYQDAGGRWLRLWQERLDRLEKESPALTWQDHSQMDDYWRSRAVRTDRMQVPAYLIGGWRDIFPEATVRTFADIAGPKKMLIGPWFHASPDNTPLEPVDWLSELARWWERWLRGRENGVDMEPRVTFFMQGRGTWHADNDWPPRGKIQSSFRLSASRSLNAAEPGEVGELSYQVDPTVGSSAGLWDPLATGYGYPIDQTVDSAKSLGFTSAFLPDDLLICGSPEARVRVRGRPGEEVFIVAKLIDLHPDGRSELITTGWSNVVEAQGEANAIDPELVELDVTVPLWATAYSVRAGHRLQLTIAGADFPRIWPTPTNAEFRVVCGVDQASTVLIPSISGKVTLTDVPRPRPLGSRNPWLIAPAGAGLETAWKKGTWSIERDLAGNGLQVVLGFENHLSLPTGGEVHCVERASASVRVAAPSEARVRAVGHWTLILANGEMVTVETSATFGRKWFACSGTVTLGDQTLLQRRWRTQSDLQGRGR